MYSVVKSKIFLIAQIRLANMGKFELSKYKPCGCLSIKIRLDEFQNSVIEQQGRFESA